MKPYFIVIYLIFLLFACVAVEVINLCCHLLTGKKPIKIFQL